ncbi:hypothetical protein OSB04_011746 [Centaurea solstitialis]|uniref:Uncharacterized protein n=1 Tax=Centaurea solstitialis TaxID=347529 RepID=A0AA38WDZ1_9ASTR|nr:hypothetical protein OSB04_011746 [Centaurea solstitialis]
MIGSLLYLTASRPDIMYSTCLCARYQAEPKESHLTAVKRIFRYLKGTPNLGLWYSKDSRFDLTAYSDSDFAGCKIDRKSTTGGCHLLGGKLVNWTSKKQNYVSTSTAEAEYVAAGICCAQDTYLTTPEEYIYQEITLFTYKIFVQNPNTDDSPQPSFLLRRSTIRAQEEHNKKQKEAFLSAQAAKRLASDFVDEDEEISVDPLLAQKAVLKVFNRRTDEQGEEVNKELVWCRYRLHLRKHGAKIAGIHLRRTRGKKGVPGKTWLTVKRSRVKDAEHTLDKLDRYNLLEWNEIRSLLPKANKNKRLK